MACTGDALAPIFSSGGDQAITVDGQFKQIAETVALVIRAGAVLVVTFGALQALGLVAAAIWQREADSPRGREIWLKFATWILLALEFALAADLVRTAVAPTWDDIGKLAVIATIRTMLNYFVAKDIAAFDQGIRTGSSRRRRFATGFPLISPLRPYWVAPIPLDRASRMWLSPESYS
jgi:uncharacterized membrane protein